MNSSLYLPMRYWILVCILILSTVAGAQQIFSNMRATQLGDSIYVQWTLNANYTCNNMILERSAGNSGFKPIFLISGFCGATVDLNYQYLDGTNLQTSETYAYRVTASNGIYISNTASVIYNNSGNDDILIFPNPATDYFSISISNTINIPFYAQVFTIDGKLIWENFLYDNLTQINSELSNGYYLIRIIADDGIPRFASVIIQQ